MSSVLPFICLFVRFFSLEKNAFHFFLGKCVFHTFIWVTVFSTCLLVYQNDKWKTRLPKKKKCGKDVFLFTKMTSGKHHYPKKKVWKRCIILSHGLTKSTRSDKISCLVFIFKKIMIKVAFFQSHRLTNFPFTCLLCPFFSEKVSHGCLA